MHVCISSHLEVTSVTRLETYTSVVVISRVVGVLSRVILLVATPCVTTSNFSITRKLRHEVRRKSCTVKTDTIVHDNFLHRAVISHNIINVMENTIQRSLCLALILFWSVNLRTTAIATTFISTVTHTTTVDVETHLRTRRERELHQRLWHQSSIPVTNVILHTVEVILQRIIIHRCQAVVITIAIQHMVRDEAVQRILAVRLISDVRIFWIHVIIQLMSLPAKIVKRLDTILLFKNRVRTHEHRVVEHTLRWICNIVILSTTTVQLLSGWNTKLRVGPSTRVNAILVACPAISWVYIVVSNCIKNTCRCKCCAIERADRVLCDDVTQKEVWRTHNIVHCVNHTIRNRVVRMSNQCITIDVHRQYRVHLFLTPHHF